MFPFLSIFTFNFVFGVLGFEYKVKNRFIFLKKKKKKMHNSTMAISFEPRFSACTMMHQNVSVEISVLTLKEASFREIPVQLHNNSARLC